MKLEQAIDRAIDRCNLMGDDCNIYSVMNQYKSIRELPEDEFEKVYDTIAKTLGFMNHEEKKEDKSMMTMKNAFTFEGRTYEMNDKGNRFFVTDIAANYCRKRISEVAYNKAFEEYIKAGEDNADRDEWDAEKEIEARKDAEERKDREAEDSFNGKKPEEPKTKKAAKPRKSKDVAFEMDTIIGNVTLTAKQVDFIHHLPDTCFWEHGLDSTPWCDVLADEIGGQFANKPMTVGAMISTLREKHLISVGQDKINGRKCKYFELTEVGKAVAKRLGLN